MTDLPLPEKKPAIKPTQVWNPSMGGQPMPVYGDRRDVNGVIYGSQPPPRDHSTWNGHEYRNVVVDAEQFFRSMYEGQWDPTEHVDVYRYATDPAYRQAAQQRHEASVRQQQRQSQRHNNVDRAGHIYPMHPDDCGHYSKRFRVDSGWDCLDCGKKLL